MSLTRYQRGQQGLDQGDGAKVVHLHDITVHLKNNIGLFVDMLTRHSERRREDVSEYLEICVLDCASMRDSCAVDKYVHVIEYGEDFFGCLENLAVVA